MMTNKPGDISERQVSFLEGELLTNRFSRSKIKYQITLYKTKSAWPTKALTKSSAITSSLQHCPKILIHWLISQPTDTLANIPTNFNLNQGDPEGITKTNYVENQMIFVTTITRNFSIHIGILKAVIKVLK